MHDRQLVIEALDVRAHGDGKISDDVAFYDSIALDELPQGAPRRVPRDHDKSSSTEIGRRGAG